MEENKIQESNDSDVMDQNTALKTLINAVHVGQSRGAWKLDEVEVLIKAIKTFQKK